MKNCSIRAIFEYLEEFLNIGHAAISDKNSRSPKEVVVNLTLSHKTNFRLFQTERGC